MLDLPARRRPPAPSVGRDRLRLVAVPEKPLAKQAGGGPGSPVGGLVKQVTTLGKAMGPPWGKDQKDAAPAALIAWKQVPM